MGFNQLPREVLKWIQSLDLSFAVRSAKRDFSNGFLVAEILSRYYEQDVSIHSYENGSSTTCKFGNWNHLRLVFRKIGFQTSTEELQLIESIIEARSTEPIAVFMLDLYHFLTSRVVETTIFERPRNYQPKQLDENWIEQMSSNQESKSNEPLLGDAAPPRNSIDRSGFHSNSLDENSSTFESASMARAATSKVLRGQPRTVRGAGAPSAQVVVKKVGVRPLNRNVTELRASRDESHNSGSTADGSVHLSSVNQSLEGSSTSANGSRSSGSKFAGVSGQFLEHMDYIVSENATAIKPMNATAVFSLRLQEGSVKEGSVFQVFNAIEQKASQLASDCVKEPIDFIFGARMFLSALATLNSNSKAFSQAVSAICEFGQSCSLASAHDSWSMFRDFLLDRLVKVARECKTVRHWVAFADISRSFGACLAHPESDLVRMIQELEQPIQTVETMHCLLQLIRSSKRNDLDDRTVEEKVVFPTYQYYAVAGLTHSSPTNRALSIQLLGELIKRGADLSVVVDAIPLIEPLYEDTWWEVRTQLALLGFTLLNDERVANDRDVYFIAEALILANFSPDEGLPLKKIVLCNAAPIAHRFSTVFQRYLDVLCDLQLPVLQELLLQEDPSQGDPSAEPSDPVPADQRMLRVLDVGAVSDIEYDTVCPCDTWDNLALAVGVCTVLESRGKREGGDSESKRKALVGLLDEHSMFLLSVCMASVRDETDAQVQEGWTRVFDCLSDALLEALTDESIVRTAVQLLTTFQNHTPVGIAVLRHPNWPQILNKLFNGVPLPECSPVVAHFVMSFTEKGSGWKSATRAMLEETIVKYPAIEDMNYMRKFLQAVE